MAKLIIGLGNPGSKYAETRHNVGFMVLDAMAQHYGVDFQPNKTFKAEIASIFLGHDKVYLVKPTTFMNNSGIAVRALMAYFDITQDEILVIYDDLDMTVGKMRLRDKGSAGGHNGIKSIMAETGSDQFLRLKIGIGRPKEHHTVVDHVLGRFDEDDKVLILQAQVKSQKLISAWLADLPYQKLQEELNRL